MGRGASDELQLGDMAPRDGGIAEARAMVEEAIADLDGVVIGGTGIEEARGRFEGRPFVELHFEHIRYSMHGTRRLLKRPEATGRPTLKDWQGDWFGVEDDPERHCIRLYPEIVGSPAWVARRRRWPVI